MIHLFPNGQVEVAARWSYRRWRGYRWSPAYSQQTLHGETQPLTRRHWYDIAYRDKEQLKFHSTREQAKEAVRGQRTRS